MTRAAPSNPLGLGLRAMIRAYQLVLSPIMAGSCRFHPSCSEYARQSVERFGPLAGTWLALRRLLRCHPWGGAGYDPVPNARCARGGCEPGHRHG